MEEMEFHSSCRSGFVRRWHIGVGENIEREKHRACYGDKKCDPFEPGFRENISIGFYQAYPNRKNDDEK